MGLAAGSDKKPGIIRLLILGAAAGIAIAPLTALAGTPSPSPPLDTLLATPPSGYTEMTSSLYHGHFTASQYAGQAADASKRSPMEATLVSDGFVDGYGNTWVNTSAGHVLIEATIAFTGARGARSWLNSAEAGDKSDATYSHADTISGIDPYYGVHILDKTSNTIGDFFAFAKGNDVFLIMVASGSDNNLSLAMSQTTAQYSSAPDSTIPSSQWPENKSSSSAAYDAGSLAGHVLFGVLVLGVIGVVVGLIVRGLRRPPTMVAYGAGAMAGAHMSPDGHYWYDGQGWRDASTEVPPTAQRSSDGTLWWDGRGWRGVPQSLQTPPNV